jgi:hypothetical protein
MYHVYKELLASSAMARFEITALTHVGAFNMVDFDQFGAVT